jgi:adenosine deaminase
MNRRFPLSKRSRDSALGIYPNLLEHPLPRLYAYGVPVTVNSDDPAMFNATLNKNVRALHQPFSFSLDTINEILLNGVRHAFLPQAEKERMEISFSREMTRLRYECGLD